MQNDSNFLDGKLFNLWMNVELAKNDSKNLQEILDDVCERVTPKVLLEYLPQLIREELLKDKVNNVKALLNIASSRNIDININANIENASQPISLFSRASKQVRALLLAYDSSKQQKSFFWEFDGHYIGSVEICR